MSRERRESQRQITNFPGSIVGAGAATADQDCVVADISEGGVRLSVKAPVPDEFTLVLKDGSNTSRRCRVVWRLDDEVGVEFIS